jgi:Gas vesicle synthesis protein GvpL/GvpF/DnaJ domain
VQQHPINGIYIYGIIKTSKPQEFGEIGIGDKTASHVLTIRFKDIAAVISNSPLTVYSSLSKEKVLKDLAIHQLVIEKVMKRFTIIPVKFGTVIETQNEVSKFLEQDYVLLSNELSKAEGKIELDVVACWDLAKILAAISHHNEQIQEKQQEIMMKGGQVATEDKIMLGQLIAQALKAEKARYQQLMLQTLKQETVDVCLHDLANDEMIFNAAFLLETKNEESFNTLVHTLDQKLENTVNFRVVGPLPLYSFSTIVFEKIDPERIEEAKKTLGLTEEITGKSLRDAYHQLAQKYHPDKRSGEASQEFQQIHEAYIVLKNFIEHGLMHTKVYRWKENL